MNEQFKQKKNIKPKPLSAKNNSDKTNNSLPSKQTILDTSKSYLDQYLAIMSRNFKLLDRFSQELLIKRICQTTTIGLTCLILGIVYSFIPEIIRVFLVPVIVLASWWLGSTVVSSVIIQRFSKYLNQE